MLRCKQVHGRVRSGFTLIEMLVVISIIAILAAIMFPVFARVRERAKQVSCMSNMRQIGMALVMYMGDKGDRLPPMIQGDSAGPGTASRAGFKYAHWKDDPTTPAERYVFTDQGGDEWHWYTWMDCLFPYTKSVQVFTCPSHSSLYPIDHLKDAYGGSPESYPGLVNEEGKEWLPSLAINGIMCASFQRNNIQNWTLSQINGPSSKIMFLHWRSRYAYSNPYDFERYANSPAGSGRAGGAGNQEAMFPHNDGANIVFVDGHTKYYNRLATVKFNCTNLPGWNNNYQAGPNGNPCGYWNPVIAPPA